MEEKIISGSDKSCTVTVSGEVTKVRFEVSCMYIQIRHLSGEIICGRKSDIADGANGTAKLTSGGICFDVASPVIYIGGNGVCEVYATNSETLVFKDAPAVSGGGSESGKSVMTLIGKFNITSSSWANIGTLEAGTRLLIESAAVKGQTTTSSNAGSIVGYAIVPNADTGSLYAKIMMLYPTGNTASSMMMNFQPQQNGTNGPVSLAGNTYIQGAFNVYKLEVPTA